MKFFYFLAFLFLFSLPALAQFNSNSACSEHSYSPVFDMSSRVQLDKGLLLHSFKLGLWGKESHVLSAFIGLKQVIDSAHLGKDGQTTNYNLGTQPFFEIGFKLFRGEHFIHRIYTQLGKEPVIGWQSGLLLQDCVLMNLYCQSSTHHPQIGFGISLAF